MSSPFDDAVNTGLTPSPSRKAAVPGEASTRSAPESEAKLRAGHRSRLRARFLADPSAMPDHEVLELLLGYVRVRHDNKILAKRLLQRFGSLSGVLSAPDAERGLVPDSGEGRGRFLRAHPGNHCPFRAKRRTKEGESHSCRHRHRRREPPAPVQ